MRWMMIWQSLNITRTNPMSEKNLDFSLDEPIPVLNRTKAKEEQEFFVEKLQ